MVKWLGSGNEGWARDDVSLDFSKTFGTVSHKTLVTKAGLGGWAATRLVKCWLDDWDQRAVVNELHFTDPCSFLLVVWVCPILHHQWPGGGNAMHPHQICRWLILEVRHAFRRQAGGMDKQEPHKIQQGQMPSPVLGTRTGWDCWEIVRQLGIYRPISRGRPAILYLVRGIKLKDIWSVVGPKNICFPLTPWKYHEGSAVTNPLFNFFFRKSNNFLKNKFLLSEKLLVWQS